MGEWECTVCGYTQWSERAPDGCPDCGAPKARLMYYAFDEDDWLVVEELDTLRELAQLELTDESEAETA